MPPTSGIRAGKAFVEVGAQDAALAKGLRRAEARLRAFGRRVQEIGQGLVKASAAAVIPLALSSKVFAGFEQQMARVRALTGASGKDFARLSDEAKRLGETTVFSAAQAAEAMSFFALAGFDVDQILKSIGPTLNLAAAGQLEIANAADIAAKIMAGMGIEADRLGYAVDVLTKAMTTANTDLLQLGDAMKFIGPIAKSAGLAFEEITAAVQLLSNAGIQGEMAGTTLRGALLSLTSPSAEAAAELANLGVQVQDAQGNVRPLADLIEQLERALKGIGTGARLESLGKIFQARQAGGIAELIDQGAQKLREYTAALQQAGGTSERIAKIQLNTLTGTVTILKSALEGLAIAIGDSIVDPVRIATHVITKAVGAASSWVKANKLLVVGLAAGAVAVGLLGGGLIAVGLAAKAAAFVVGGLATALSAVKIVAVGVGAAIAALATPVGAAITLLSGLGLAAVLYSGVASKALFYLGQQWQRLKNFATRALDGIRDAMVAGDIELAAEILWLSLKLVWQKGAAALEAVWLGLKQAVLTVANTMFYGAVAAAEYAMHGIEVVWIETTAFLSRTWTQLTSALAGFWNDFAAGFQETWNGAINFTTKRFLELQGLFDRGLDVDAAKRMADEGLADANAEIERKHAARSQQIDQQREEALADRERRREDERATSAALHEATLATIGSEFEQAQQDLKDSTAAQLSETERALNDARSALNQAIERARRGREEIDRGGGGEGPGRLDLKKIEKEISDRLSGVADRVSVQGTFNPAAIRALSGGNDQLVRLGTDQLAVLRRIERKKGATFI